MTEEYKKAEKIKKTVLDTIKLLRENYEFQWKQISGVLPDFVYAEQKLLEFAENEMVEIEIPTEILLQQLQNLEISIRNKDIVLLADTLEYEVCESISFYMQLLKESETGELCGLK